MLDLNTELSNVPEGADVCVQCLSQPDLTAQEITQYPPDDVLGWLRFNDGGDFAAFVLSEFPDAMAEYHNTVTARHRTQALADHAAAN